MSHLKFLFVTFFVFAGFEYNYGQLELYFTAKYHDNYYPLDSIIIENTNAGSGEKIYFCSFPLETGHLTKI